MVQSFAQRIEQSYIKDGEQVSPARRRDKNHYIVLRRNLRNPSEKDGLLISSLVVRGVRESAEPRRFLPNSSGVPWPSRTHVGQNGDFL